MGGRGAFSWGSQESGYKRRKANPLVPYAAAAINIGNAKGASTQKAIASFRDHLLGEKYEFSAYIDKHGFVHTLGSSHKEGSTALPGLEAVAKQKGITTIIHNHPADKKRQYGGTFSGPDLLALNGHLRASGGKVNTIVATAKEGTYIAKMKKPVSDRKIKLAVTRADKKTQAMGTFPSKKKMWEAVHKNLATEVAKIGIELEFKPGGNSKKKFIKQPLLPTQSELF